MYTVEAFLNSVGVFGVGLFRVLGILFKDKIDLGAYL